MSIDRDISIRQKLKPFNQFLQMEGVTEIAVNRPGQLYYEREGVWNQVSLPSLTYDALIELGITAAKYSGDNVNFSKTEPIVSVTLPDGERAQFIQPPACSPELVSLTIRKPSLKIISVDDFYRSGFFNHMRKAEEQNPKDEELLEIYEHLQEYEEGAKKRVEFLRKAVRYGKNIVIAGETGSGKTTFMKALMQDIPRDERIVTIEDVPELVHGLPYHDNKVCLFYPSEAKRNSNVTAASLMRSCLRMKPDRILLAELRGPETFDFLNICLSGHGGSITSCHAGSCEDVFKYRALKVQQAEDAKTMTTEQINRYLQDVIDVVVHIHNDKKGIGRHITDIWFKPARLKS